MSQLQVNRINDASGGVLAPISSVMRNRIINGAMTISQRNGTSSITPTDGQYTLDRWKAQLSQASKYTVQQDAGGVTAPAGFNDYLGVTSSSAYSVLSSDVFFLVQPIEGFNTADLNWGTANAKTVTLSFWVRSSLTGTFGGSLRNSAGNRSYPFSYTITAANIWEQKSITIVGDTTGTWSIDSSTGISVSFSLGCGSTFTATGGAWAAGNFVNATGATSVVGTNGATFYITGVQLEVGTQATSFEYRQYGTEFQLCQRYFQQLDAACTIFTRWNTGYPNTGTGSFTLPITMRGTPTFSASGLTGKNIYNMAADSNINVGTPTLALDVATNTSARIFIGASTSLGGTSGAPLIISGTGTVCSFSAEL
jgi:hypothetical protein